MDKKLFGFLGNGDETVVADQMRIQELSDLQLALIGGGIGDTVLPT